MKIQQYGNGGLFHGIEVQFEVREAAGLSHLQVVQVFYGSPLEGYLERLAKVQSGRTTYAGWVDPGVKSPAHLDGHQPERVPNMPYYYAWNDLSRAANFKPEIGVGTIRIYDRPNGVRQHEEAYFETAIVGVPAEESPDRTLAVIKWGWVGAGRHFCPAPGVEAGAYEPLEAGEVSAEFRSILADNYPGYRLG